MDESIKYVEYTVLIFGLLTVFGILYESHYMYSEMPTGYSVLGDDVPCHGGCSCQTREVCVQSNTCCYTNKCTPCTRGMPADGLKLVYEKRVGDGSSFTVNAVVSSSTDQNLVVALSLPNGFRMVGGENAVLKLGAGEVGIVRFQVEAVENTAQGPHIIHADLIDEDFEFVSQAQADVDVYWD